jgi:hypothetical protein
MDIDFASFYLVFFTMRPQFITIRKAGSAFLAEVRVAL